MATLHKLKCLLCESLFASHWVKSRNSVPWNGGVGTQETELAF